MGVGGIISVGSFGLRDGVGGCSLSQSSLNLFSCNLIPNTFMSPAIGGPPSVVPRFFLMMRTSLAILVSSVFNWAA